MPITNLKNMLTNYKHIIDWYNNNNNNIFLHRDNSNNIGGSLETKEQGMVGKDNEKPKQLAEQAKALLRSYKQAKMRDEIHLPRQPTQHQWSRLPPSMYKLT